MECLLASADRPKIGSQSLWSNWNGQNLLRYLSVLNDTHTRAGDNQPNMGGSENRI